MNIAEGIATEYPLPGYMALHRAIGDPDVVIESQSGLRFRFRAGRVVREKTNGQWVEAELFPLHYNYRYVSSNALKGEVLALIDRHNASIEDMRQVLREVE